MQFNQSIYVCCLLFHLDDEYEILVYPVNISSPIMTEDPVFSCFLDLNPQKGP
jgi:hypothetical protein